MTVLRRAGSPQAYLTSNSRKVRGTTWCWNHIWMKAFRARFWCGMTQSGHIRSEGRRIGKARITTILTSCRAQLRVMKLRMQFNSETAAILETMFLLLRPGTYGWTTFRSRTPGSEGESRFFQSAREVGHP